tara:strand:- start:1775 stop:2020 length:246 start_codon:yes stop_codon:yes gene_type:complete
MKKQKLLIESIKYITGQQSSIKIKGEPTELKAFKQVLNASRTLYESLQNPNAKLKEVERLVAIKNKAAQRFQEITGKSWPL